MIMPLAARRRLTEKAKQFELDLVIGQTLAACSLLL
jgi:hypothetical protein